VGCGLLWCMVVGGGESLLLLVLARILIHCMPVGTLTSFTHACCRLRCKFPPCACAWPPQTPARRWRRCWKSTPCVGFVLAHGLPQHVLGGMQPPSPGAWRHVASPLHVLDGRQQFPYHVVLWRNTTLIMVAW
jgi:hypothetical protein